MNGLLRSEFATNKLNASIGYDLIHVHVGLRSRSGLPHVQREVLIEGAADDFIAHSFDEGALPNGKAVMAGIDNRRGLLDITVRVINLVRHSIMTDVEVDQAALGLRTPVAVGRDHHGAEAVEFFTLPRALQSNR